MVTSPRRHSSSSLAPHRRSAIADRSAPLPLLRCSVLGALPPTLPQDISIFFSLFLSLKWKKWEYDMKFLQKATDRRSSSEIGSASAPVQRYSLPVAPSGSPAFLQGFSLWLSLSLSLSLYLTEILNEKMKGNLWTFLSLFFNFNNYLISHLSKSLSLLNGLLLAGFYFFFFFFFCFVFFF